MHFNSHAHVERDVVLQLVLISRKHFNSHAHVERDNFASGLTNEQLNFNSHAHVERDHKPQPYLQILTNFNSHAHVERDFNSRSNSLVLHISTHTLTWSVTGGSAPPQSFRPISTHTLTWSVTCAWRRALKTYGHFNSHAHVERDNRKTPPHFDNWHFNSHAHVERDFWELGILNAKKISTHTLTWSVTYQIADEMLKYCISTHTLTWSVTMQKKLANLLTVHFNSHAHVERDINLNLAKPKTINFNSHAHVERDQQR